MPKNTVTIECEITTTADVEISAADFAEFSDSELADVGLIRASKSADAPYHAARAAELAKRGDNEALLEWAREQLYTVYGIPVFSFTGGAQ